MTATLLVNATYVNDGSTRVRDILLENGHIVKIDNTITPKNEYKIIDCSGLLVLPGVIDDQVHFREPGAVHKATIASESRAAVLGGTTSFMDMPNNNPSITSLAGLNTKREIAVSNSLANYSFYLGATADNLDEIKAVDPRRVCGIKIFMGSSTGSLLVEDDDAIRNIFKASQIPVATHCEDNAIINENMQAFVAKYGRENLKPYMHPEIRSREACLKSTKRAIRLAEEVGGNLHVLHLSTREEVELFQKYASLPVAERRITAEACIPHLFFAEDAYTDLGNRLKCNPAVKGILDREALVNAVATGVITTIGTDHAPHTVAEKDQPYCDAPSGLPTIQFSLLAMLDLVNTGKLSIEQVVTAMCHNPALRFNVDSRGFIREGYWADIVIINPKAEFTVRPHDIASKCGWSPFVGHTFSSKVVHTFVNGNQVVNNGKLSEQFVCGRELEFCR